MTEEEKVVEIIEKAAREGWAEVDLSGRGIDGEGTRGKALK